MQAMAIAHGRSVPRDLGQDQADAEHAGPLGQVRRARWRTRESLIASPVRNSSSNGHFGEPIRAFEQVDEQLRGRGEQPEGEPGGHAPGEPRRVQRHHHITIMDPIDSTVDPACVVRLECSRAARSTTRDQYAPNTLASSRLMHLIIAEDALANCDEATFTSEINSVRAMDALTPYSGQMPAMDMLRHERGMNTFGMGLRLADMYRFGVKEAQWIERVRRVQVPGDAAPDHAGGDSFQLLPERIGLLVEGLPQGKRRRAHPYTMCGCASPSHAGNSPSCLP